MPFEMPTPQQIAQLDTTAIDNIRLEAEKHALTVSATLTDIKVARNELKRKDVDLADKAAKSLQLLREIRLAIDTLKTAYWQKRT